ncbi:MAG: hypothetical protein V1806_00115 [Pseudomonadota bacterium]
MFCRGINGEVMEYIASSMPPVLKRTGDPLTAGFHVDFTRWDFHQAANGVTVDTVERLGVPLNFIKDLRPLAQRH